MYYCTRYGSHRLSCNSEPSGVQSKYLNGSRVVYTIDRRCHISRDIFAISQIVSLWHIPPPTLTHPLNEKLTYTDPDPTAGGTMFAFLHWALYKQSDIVPVKSNIVSYRLSLFVYVLASMIVNMQTHGKQVRLRQINVNVLRRQWTSSCFHVQSQESLVRCEWIICQVTQKTCLLDMGHAFINSFHV